MRIGLEPLEARAMLTASLAPIANISSPAGLGYQVPLDGSASGVPSQTFAATSTNPTIKATVARGQFLTLNVSHTSSGTGDPSYSGSMTFQLFEDLTPLTTSKIENLVNLGFYNGKNFHRISSGFPDANGFIAQGGSVNGQGNDSPPSPGQPGGLPASGYPFPDEFNKQLLFDGSGQLAMANAGRDTNTSQFFITSSQPNSLNFGYTLFGQLVAGQAIYNDIIHTSTGSSTSTTPASPILINTATLSMTNPDGVVHIDTTGATQGATGQVTVTATDPSTSTTATQTFTVTVGPNVPAGYPYAFNKPFLPLPPAPITVGKGQSAVFDSHGVATSPGDTLSYTVQAGYADASQSAFTPVPATEGTASVDANGIVTFKPASGFSGPVKLLVGVRDQTDRSGTGTLNTPSNYDTNAVTITVNSSATQIGLQPIALPVSATAAGSAPVQITLAGQSANPGSGQTLSYTILTQPAHGTLSAPNAAGVVTYTAAANYVGPDSFTYSATSVGGPSPNLTSPAATVTINDTTGSTNAVRLLGRTLIVTPPPNFNFGRNTISVVEVGGNIQVTVNGTIDANQPAATALDKIIVYGGNTGTTIGIDPSVTVPTLLDGGHGGTNFVTAGGADSRIHGWFGKNIVQGGVGANAIVGRKGLIKVFPSSGTDSVFLSGINPYHRQPHEHLKDIPPTRRQDPGAYYKFVGNKLVRTKQPVTVRLSQATTTTTTTTG